MKLNKGLNLDLSPLGMQEGMYPYGKNCIINDEWGTVENEKGFDKLDILPSGHDFCGYIQLKGDKYIVFTHDSSGETYSDGETFYGRPYGYTIRGVEYIAFYMTEQDNDDPGGKNLAEGVHKIENALSEEWDIIEKGVRTKKVGASEPREYNYFVYSKVWNQDSPRTTIKERVASGGIDYIGIIENDQYRVLSSTLVFNFNKLFPVTGVARYTNSGTIQAVFRDGLNRPKIVTLHPEDGILEDTIANTLLFSDLKIPIYDLVDVEPGGSLKEGAYYGTIRYIRDDRGTTECFPLSNPIFIHDKRNRPKDTVLTTGNRIKLQISNIDQNFDSFELIFVQYINGIYSSFIVGEYVINSNVETVVYTGEESLIDISLSEILVTRPAYQDVKSMATLDNQLYLGNMYIEENAALQRRANDITVKWYRGPTDVNIANPLPEWENYKAFSFDKEQYRDPRASFYIRGYKGGEIMALYIAWVKDGRVTRGYHIPGRTARTSIVVKDDAGTNQNIVGTAENPAEVWSVQDTQDYITATYSQTANYLNNDKSLGSNVRLFQTRDLMPTATFVLEGAFYRFYAEGEMCYWQNENEVYEDTFPDFAGENVRHHKFPSERAMDNAINNVLDEEWTYGIKVSGVDVTDFDGYIIYYATPETTVLGQGPLYGDSPINWVESQQGVQWVSDYSDGFRFPCFSMLHKKKPLGATYFNVLLKDATIPLVYTSGSVVGGSKEEYSIFYANYNRIDHSATDYKIFVAPIKEGTLKYVPLDNEAAILPTGDNNKYREESIIGAIDTTYGLNLNDPSNSQYIADMKKYVTDVYQGYQNQQLVSTGTFNTGSSATIYGGNCFKSQVVVKVKKANNEEGSNYIVLSSRIDKVESLYNYNLLNAGTEWYEGYVGDYNWTWNPNSVLDSEVPEDLTKSDIANSKDPNYIDYNTDLSRINNITAVGIYNNVNIVNTFPTRIARSLKQSEESGVYSWKDFLPADYYEMSRDTGSIVKIMSYKENLFIQTQYGMFLTRGKAQLQTTAAAVSLGTGNIFEFPPVNLMEGYGGIDNYYNSIVSKSGIVTVDPNSGKIFLYADGIKDITPGIFTYLRTRDIYDTKVAYDDYYNRFIFSNALFTISYSLYTQSWAFFHDYAPSYVFGYKNLYSINDDLLYRHNVGSYGVYYDPNTIYPSYVDASFNYQPNDSKVLANIQYIDEVENNLGVKEKYTTMTHLSIRNATQHSGLISLTPKTTFYGTGNIEREKDVWLFQDIKDRVNDPSSPIVDSIDNDYEPITANLADRPWYENRDFTDKFAVVRFYNDNAGSKKWKLYEVGANFLSPDGTRG